MFDKSFAPRLYSRCACFRIRRVHVDASHVLPPGNPRKAHRYIVLAVFMHARAHDRPPSAQPLSVRSPFGCMESHGPAVILRAGGFSSSFFSISNRRCSMFAMRSVSGGNFFSMATSRLSLRYWKFMKTRMISVCMSRIRSIRRASNSSRSCFVAGLSSGASMVPIVPTGR